MRVHRKTPLVVLGKIKDDTSDDGVDYKDIFENIKNYLVFRISVTPKLSERLIYLDVLDFVGRISLEVNKNKRGNER